MIKSYTLLGGPAHGSMVEAHEGHSTFAIHKCEMEPLRRPAHEATNDVVEMVIYRKRRYAEDHRRYVVFVVDGLEDNVALDLFKTYMPRIPVDEYVRPMYHGTLEEQRHNRRIYFMNELLPVGPSGKPGKATKTFVMAYCYGASIRTLQKKTGLGLRRIKVMKKRIDNFGGLMAHGNRH